MRYLLIVCLCVAAGLVIAKVRHERQRKHAQAEAERRRLLAASSVIRWPPPDIGPKGFACGLKRSQKKQQAKAQEHA